MSNLVKHAHRELTLAGLGPTDKNIDPMNRLMGKQILAIVKNFSKQGHSGFSASYAVKRIEKLLNYEPILPLTGDDDEWESVEGFNGIVVYQNVRCSRVFKEVDADGRERAYDIYGKVFRDKNGSNWTNSKSHVNITFPYIPKSRYINRRWWKFWL